jgi:hypothetical protein
MHRHLRPPNLVKRDGDGLTPFPLAWSPRHRRCLWKNYFQRARSPVAFDPDDPFPGYRGRGESFSRPSRRLRLPLKTAARKKARFTVLPPCALIVAFRPRGASPLAIIACALVSASRRGTVPVNLAAPVLYSNPTEGGTEAYPSHLRIFPAYDIP